ncbi:MAG: hypothetical protein KH135_02180 [Firmicutes bacterium]|nr:hypothetical protein [Bacillota bacterium]
MFERKTKQKKVGDTFSELQNLATLMSRKNHKNRLMIMNDMKKCKKKYGCSYEEYYFYRFDELSEEEKDTIITKDKNQIFIDHFNAKAKASVWHEKKDLYKNFNTSLKREFLYLTGDNLEMFQKYAKSHQEMIAKTNEHLSRTQIRKVVLTEHMKADKVYEGLMEKNLTILDEVIIQHPKMKELYPKSVNTIEFITLKNKGKVHITSAILKIGHGTIVDNVYYGGMLAKIDLKTGIVMTKAVDYRDHLYTTHPSSKTKIVDFEIPCFQAAKEFVLNLALKTNDASYISWNIAITEDGPVFVDASITPNWYQFPEFIKDKKGKLKEMELVYGKKIEFESKRTK